MHWRTLVHGLEALGVDMVDVGAKKCFMCRGGAVIQHIPKVDAVPERIIGDILNAFSLKRADLDEKIRKSPVQASSELSN